MSTFLPSTLYATEGENVTSDVEKEKKIEDPTQAEQEQAIADNTINKEEQ